MEIIKTESKRKTQKLKVGAYARVSTDKEEQDESYDTQVSYFEDLINANPRWEFVEVYADQGKTGLCAAKRPNFLRMIADAEAGKLDLILVKSISRFGRNSLEAQEYVHKLKGLGVEVQFEKEGFSSFDAQSEMIFNFLTAIAEEGSKSISKNVRIAYKRLAEQGIRHIGNNRVLGYDEIDGELVPNEQAWIPKLIFEAYAEGRGFKEIADELEKRDASRLRSDKSFTVSQILCILENEIYVGDRQIQKAPHTDYKTKRPMTGTDYETFYVEEDHEGIVSREVWDRVQNRLKSEKTDRDNGIYRRPNSHFLFGRILCGECGEPMIRRVEKSKSGEKVTWICKDRRKGKKGNGCKNLIIPEEELLEALTETLGAKWNGIDSVDERVFDKLKTVKIYDDGSIEVELNEEKKTA